MDLILVEGYLVLNICFEWRNWKVKKFNKSKYVEVLLLFVFELDYDSRDKLITLMHANTFNV